MKMHKNSELLMKIKKRLEELSDFVYSSLIA